MSKKCFSIIMPVWNRMPLVLRAIKSVLAQSFQDFELLVIDDGSCDNLEQGIKSYLSERVIYKRIEHSGVSKARNTGLEIARGKYIAYLDSDNVWHPDFLETMKNALVSMSNSFKVAYCNCNVYKRGAHSEKIISGIVGEPFSFKRLFYENIIDLNTFVHANECLDYSGKFDEKLARLVDWDFIVRITARYTPLYVPENLVDYYHSFADNTISQHQNLASADKKVRRKNMTYQKPVKIVHDAITYSWDSISNEKYDNWIRMENKDFNTNDYIAWGYPFMLQIEPTNICNLKCPLCPVGKNELNRPSKHMTLQEFRSIIDDTEKFLLFLILWDWGEPFANPEFPEMIRYASDREIKTVTSTNAHYLQNEEYVRRILCSGLSTLIIAIDSLDDEQYQVYRKGGKLSKALEGLKRLVRMKHEIKSDTLINLRMVVMKQNEHEVSLLKRLAKELHVDAFTIKTVNPSCGLSAMDEEMLPEKLRYRRYEYKKGTYERIRKEADCCRIWTMSNIFSNGDVVPCGYDYDARLKIGNVLKTPFSELWNGPEYRALRKKILHEKTTIPRCNECGMNYQLYNEDWFVEKNVGKRVIKRVKNLVKASLGRELLF